MADGIAAVGGAVLVPAPRRLRSLDHPVLQHEIRRYLNRRQKLLEAFHANSPPFVSRLQLQGDGSALAHRVDHERGSGSLACADGIHLGGQVFQLVVQAQAGTGRLEHQDAVGLEIALFAVLDVRDAALGRSSGTRRR